MTSEAVHVIARIRPELSGSSVLSIQDESTIVLLPKPYDGNDAMEARRARDAAAKGFKLDRVYGPLSSQNEVYMAAKPLALSVTQGYNATIFARQTRYTIAHRVKPPRAPPRVKFCDGSFCICPWRLRAIARPS